MQTDMIISYRVQLNKKISHTCMSIPFAYCALTYILVFVHVTAPRGKEQKKVQIPQWIQIGVHITGHNVQQFSKGHHSTRLR